MCNSLFLAVPPHRYLTLAKTFMEKSILPSDHVKFYALFCIRDLLARFCISISNHFSFSGFVFASKSVFPVFAVGAPK